MRAATLCSGYEGFGLALGFEPVWVCEYEAAPSRVLAHHHPDAPNLGDLTAVDWSAVEPVDLLCAGYPCQPFSHAGKREGTNDDRHLWPFVAEAVRVLRPRHVFLENVAGHLSLGFGDVLGDLAEAGYDARWCCVRASDVGAPHRRERVFVLAADTRSAGTGRDGGAVPRAAEEGGRSGADVHASRDARGIAATDANYSGLSEHGRGVADGAPHAAAQCRGESPADATHIRHERGGDAWGWGTGPADCGDTAPDPDPDRASREARDGRPGTGDARRLQPLDRGAPNWGQYATAIRRWEALTRPAPAPTDDKGRLSPRFVEWMMGLPDGWVCDVPDTNRTAQLKMLGNGIVPQQARAAWLQLAHVAEVAA